MIMYLIIAYCAGVIITFGAIDGIREEMDGIGDIILILLWPVYWILKGIGAIASLLYKIGRYIGPR